MMNPFESLEHGVVGAVQWLRLAVELLGALIVACGVFVSTARVVKVLLSPPPREFNEVRIALARYLALALEFQLGADILSTAIAPSWDQIGKLGAVAVIRTALNFFLMREMRDEPKARAAERNSEAGTTQKPVI